MQCLLLLLLLLCECDSSVTSPSRAVCGGSALPPSQLSLSNAGRRKRRRKRRAREKGLKGERAEGFDANPREDSDAHDDDEEEEDEDNTSTTNTNTNMEKKKWSEKNGKQSWSRGCSTGKKGN